MALNQKPDDKGKCKAIEDAPANVSSDDDNGDDDGSDHPEDDSFEEARRISLLENYRP